MSKALIRRRQLMTMIGLEDAEGYSIVFQTNTSRRFDEIQVYGKIQQESSASFENPKEIHVPGENGNIEINIFGGNLIKFPYLTSEKTENGIQCTAQSDRGIKFVGTATKDVFFDISNIEVQDPYIISGSKDGVEIVEVDGIIKAKINSGASVNTIIYPMLNIGKSPLDYSPYKDPQNFTIPIPDGLSGVPTGYGTNYIDDTGTYWLGNCIDFKSKKYTKSVEKVVLNGSENWYPNNSGNYFYSDTYDFAIDRFVSTVGAVNYSVIDEGGYGLAFAYFFRLRTAEWSPSSKTPEELRQYLSENPITVYAVLNNPIETPISQEVINDYNAICANSPVTTILNDSGAWMKTKYKIRR